MDRIRFAILGGGWRSEFYTRAAKATPDRFDLRAVWMRNPEKAKAYAAKYAVPVLTDIDDLFRLDVDFIVVSLNPWQPHMEYAMRVIEKGFPILMETPPAPDVESLNAFWDFCREHHARIRIAEEYHLQPYHASIIELVRRGLIGRPSHASISMMHGYHCANVARQLLQLGMEEFEVRARSYTRSIAGTFDKDAGELRDHSLLSVQQICAAVDFAGGKSLFYDFCDEQYFSLIRTPVLRLCGERGEIFGNRLCFISDDGKCFRDEIRRVDLGSYGSLRPICHRGFSFCGDWIYENPLPGAALTDDEIAVASNLIRMRSYLESGVQEYSLADACQDTYIFFAMQQSAQQGRPIASSRQHWHE